MIGWSQYLGVEDAESIRAYVAAQARALQDSEGVAPRPSPAGIEPPIIEPPIVDPPVIETQPIDAL
jgi:hypothetical protein